MKTLDDVQEMETLDPSGVLDSTNRFADQCEQAWNESSVIEFPSEYKTCTSVVVCGMGGSRFTPRTIQSLFVDRVNVPYEIIDDYILPAHVGPKTLVILSSYSGTTAEVVSCGLEAIARGAKVTAVAKGGTIQDLMKQNSFPCYIFDATHNPSEQPRIGGGYLLFGHMGLLTALGYLTLSNEEVHEAIKTARSIAVRCHVDTTEDQNPAKRLAHTLKDTHPFLIGAEFLRGFVNGFANQINETAKMISDYRYIPELNHHLMEGLKHPETLKKTGLFVFFTSHLYSEPIRKRFAITQDVVEKQEIKTHMIELTADTKLAQIMEAYILSGYTTFYMAMLYGIDPAAIPWVDYFKSQLGK